MFGRYICEKCGAECDPNEIHNGICDDCREEEQNSNDEKSTHSNDGE